MSDLWFRTKLWKKILIVMIVAFVIVYLVYFRTTPVYLNSGNISKIYIGMYCTMTDDIIDGKASIKEKSDIEDAVRVLNRLEATRGEYSFEELSGEPPQAIVTCYDQYDNEIDEIRFYDNFVMVDKKLYKISNASYRKLGGLCERYGECSIIEV